MCVCVHAHIYSVKTCIYDVMRSLEKSVTDRGRAVYDMRVMDWWRQ